MSAKNSPEFRIRKDVKPSMHFCVHFLAKNAFCLWLTPRKSKQCQICIVDIFKSQQETNCTFRTFSVKESWSKSSIISNLKVHTSSLSSIILHPYVIPMCFSYLILLVLKVGVFSRRLSYIWEQLKSLVKNNTLPFSNISSSQG